MSNARDKANIPALNFSSTGIDDNATSTAITIDSSERIGIGSTAPGTDAGANADSLVIKKASGNVGMSIITDGSSNANIFLGDTSDDLNALVQFNDSANELRVGTANGGGDLVLKSGASVEALRIDDTGKVGIGTSSPGAGLEVSNSNGIKISRSGYSQYMQLYPANNNVPTILGLGGNGIHIGTTTTTGIHVDGSDNIGIGETAPQGKLHVRTADSGATVNSDADELIVENGTSGAAGGISILSATNGYGNLFFGDSGDSNVGLVQYDHSNNAMRFFANASERMRITSSGLVGIGTSSPTSNLHVESSTGTALLKATGTDTGATLVLNGNKTSNTAGIGSIQFQNNGDSVGMLRSFRESANDAGGLSFWTQATGGANSERMRINSSGLVMAGTTSPVNLGHTFKAIADSSLYFALSAEDHATGDAAIRGILSFASGNNGSGGTGYLYVGRTSDGDKFHVRSDGDVNNTNNSYGSISDRNLKENEVDASSQWNDIKAIQVKNYNLKSLPDKTHLGVIAQDLEASGMNGLVKTDEDGTKSVKYSILYMKSVKALQEAMTRIESLEAEVTALKNQP